MQTPHGDRRRWERMVLAAEEEVKAVLRALPPPLRARVRDIPIVFERVPGRDRVRDGVDPDLMGLFVGDAVEEEDQHPEPTQVFLFLENIWEEAAHDAEEYRRQVRDTLLHEIGHYLGLDEDGLAERDLE
jgi:predicted Zn-dependent protease with MMP-like domain